MIEKLTDEEKEYYFLVKKAFSALAPFYDTITLPFSGIMDKAVNFTNTQKGSKILDVATGTGKLAFAFAKEGYDVVGIDLSEAMLDIARKKNKYSKVRLKMADATNLPFADNSFDISSISFALHDMPLSIREKVLKEMGRVTRPEGTILVLDYDLPKNRISRLFVYWLNSLFESEYYKDFIKSDLEALLCKHGITVIEREKAMHGAARILKGINKKAKKAIKTEKAEKGSLNSVYKSCTIIS